MLGGSSTFAWTIGFMRNSRKRLVGVIVIVVRIVPLEVQPLGGEEALDFVI